MIALIALTTIFVFPFLSVMLPLYVRNLLHLGPDRMGYPDGRLGQRFARWFVRPAQRRRAATRFRFMTGAVSWSGARSSSCRALGRFF